MGEHRPGCWAFQFDHLTDPDPFPTCSGCERRRGERRKGDRRPHGWIRSANTSGPVARSYFDRRQVGANRASLKTWHTETCPYIIASEALRHYRLAPNGDETDE